MKEGNKFFTDAYSVGLTLDLSKAHYGPHSRTKRYYETTGYYPLLAGLARKIGAQTAIDIGTHYGGSALALKIGIGLGKGIVVSVDIRQRNAEALKLYPRVKLITGSSIDPATVNTVFQSLPEVRADILYIDSFHNYEHTMKNVGIYSEFEPKFIVFDDISINDEMKQAWSELSNKYPSFDATGLCNRNCGFGALDLR